MEIIREKVIPMNGQCRSFFGRLNLGWDDRYLLEVNLRADGSSRFNKNNRWGYFPSFSGAWRLSEEAFMEDTRSWLDNLKLRAFLRVVRK